MPALRLDVLGLVDTLAGILLWFTASPLPAIVAEFHAGFLVFKGVTGFVNPVRLPLPFYVIGGAADVISAAILYTGTPPFLAGYKAWIAGFLFLKGVWTFLGFMQ